VTLSTFTQARIVCAYYFAGPGLIYGMFTSRMPALSMQTGTNEAQIGLILLLMGISGMVSLALSGWMIEKCSSRTVLLVSTPLLCLTLPLAGMAASPLQLGIASAAVGLTMGFVDVAMNTQAIQIERAHFRPCLSLMHAGYSTGGVLGSAAGALFAAFPASPFLNFSCVLAFYLAFYPWTFRHMQKDGPSEKAVSQKSDNSLPLFVLLCGALSTICYSVEGSVGEWGSLLLFSEKGAGESLSALVFGAFSTAMCAGRMAGDRLRSTFGDFPLLLAGSSLALLGMTTVLFSPWPTLCLCGYTVMGLGLAPLVPVFFSRAGNTVGISPARASAVVSFMGYSGMLIFPPILGWLAHHSGLGAALSIVPILCGILAAGAWLFRSTRPSLRHG